MAVFKTAIFVSARSEFNSRRVVELIDNPRTSSEFGRWRDYILLEVLDFTSFDRLPEASFLQQLVMFFWRYCPCYHRGYAKILRNLSFAGGGE